MTAIATDMRRELAGIPREFAHFDHQFISWRAMVVSPRIGLVGEYLFPHECFDLRRHFKCFTAQCHPDTFPQDLAAAYQFFPLLPATSN